MIASDCQSTFTRKTFWFLENTLTGPQNISSDASTTASKEGEGPVRRKPQALSRVFTRRASSRSQAPVSPESRRPRVLDAAGQARPERGKGAGRRRPRG